MVWCLLLFVFTWGGATQLENGSPWLIDLSLWTPLNSLKRKWQIHTYFQSARWKGEPGEGSREWSLGEASLEGFWWRLWEQISDTAARRPGPLAFLKGFQPGEEESFSLEAEGKRWDVLLPSASMAPGKPDLGSTAPGYHEMEGRRLTPLFAALGPSWEPGNWNWKCCI